ncbi:tRNA (adenosine(37)-N6)-threonylcarbamoyltransferase complex transferase subunit TsaD [Synechococcus sp. PCC 7336]|uniref:tRNA (adenosine(37)-N6)-threonylcarbamoyltransferase complex transferase subunit TsaD n=1 Tax=Synechococcus sp. PCC 7336 TaxID=195250 RepID=UPI000346B1C7|nr:tRNA (adenosine(37)-N6)-threonylcarbamoyltransferase complex transferase subunit TsaD [Synechococcus sp. PCC 7336]
MATVLAIETSCDETAAAVVTNRNVLSSIVASQIDLHAQYGGVVPEVASRAHVATVQPVVAQALSEAGVAIADLDAIAVTCAPGLVGALLVGVMAAKTLALVHHLPLIGVHHLEGHIYSGFLTQPDLQPPLLALLVSGGHTSSIHVRAEGDYETVGQTCDDAAGEAFDKVARLLGLGYPGGPAIDRLARSGNPKRFPLPEGKVKHPYNTSFSGLKTAVLRLVQKLAATGDPLPVADIAASFQATVARVLTAKAIACATDLQLPHIVLTGGVAANSELRSRLQAAAAAAGIGVAIPPLKLCTDNAAMIGAAAVAHCERGEISSLDLGVQSRLALEQIESLYPTAASTIVAAP